MKSRTSFSNLTTFKKDLTRFAPVWGLYLIGMLLVLISNSGYDYDRYARNYIPDLISSFGVVNLIYAALCAVMLFGDLYNTRMCYSLHTIPQKRETMFLSHMAAGLWFSLVPNAVTALYLMTQLQNYWFIALYWLLAVTLQFVFFFGVAACSAMLTANRFAMLLVYAGINFVALLAYWVLDTIYLPFMPGVVLNYESFSLLTPVVKLFNFDYLAFDAIEVPYHPNSNSWIPENYSHTIDDTTTFFQYTGLSTGWSYTAVLAVIGLAAAALALLLYKLRHLECAGDFVAFPKLKNAACAIMTVCVASVAALLGGEVLSSGGMILWLAVGLVVGFFGSLMLLERRVKVFRKKTFLGFGILTAVLIASFLAVVFDVFGIVHWMPKTSEVESVTLSNYYSSNNYYNYDEYYYGGRLSVKLTEEDDIAQILTAHQDILNRLNKESEDSSIHQVVLTYTLNDGRKVIRNYNAPAEGTNYTIVSKYLYSPQQLLGYTDWSSYLESVDHIMVSSNNVPEDMYEQFLTALKADCENGFVTTDYRKDSQYWVDIETENPNGSYTHRNLCLQAQAENTLALLESPEFILGYEDWETYLSSVTYVDVSGTELPPGAYSEFLAAMLLDAQNGALTLREEDGKYAAYSVIIYAKQVDRFIYITEKATNSLSWFEEYKMNLQ